MIYSIRLTIAHKYDQPAANGRHLIRVRPRTIPGRQRLTTHLLGILPEPAERGDSTDFFGNPVTTCVHGAPHSEMSLRLACHVEMLPPLPWMDLSPCLSGLRHEWQGRRDLGAESPLHFLGPSGRMRPDPAISHFSQGILEPTASVVATVIRFGQALHTAMAFDPMATSVDTPPGEAFRLRRGVCQDFTQIMILGLQALGIPAAYVSGYLRTQPPKGGIRLEGADAMHAWVRAWCGADQGWIEYDPTNATLVGTDHIVVGYGRDYADIAPLSGHLRSAGGQRNAQSVDVALVG